MVKDDAQKREIAQSADVVVDINERQSCDVELIVNGKKVSFCGLLLACVTTVAGGFSPLEGFMNSSVYDGVVEDMRLPGSNLLFGKLDDRSLRASNEL